MSIRKTFIDLLIRKTVKLWHDIMRRELELDGAIGDFAEPL